MSYRCHGAVFRASRGEAVAAFNRVVDRELSPELIQINDDVFGVRATRSVARDRLERLDSVALQLSQEFIAAFTIWYESIWSAYRFSVFVQGCLYASLRTDGKDDDQWLDADGKAFAFGPPQVLSSDGALLTKRLRTLPGPRDAGRDCDLAVAGAILGIEFDGYDDEELFRWDVQFPAIERKC